MWTEADSGSSCYLTFKDEFELEVDGECPLEWETTTLSIMYEPYSIMVPTGEFFLHKYLLTVDDLGDNKDESITYLQSLSGKQATL